ncbi:MAG: hypothetical protein ACRBM6_33240 [Geminicoccales bacterium]
MSFHRWGLRFKQSSLGHITRVLHSTGLGVFTLGLRFSAMLLFRQAFAIG